MQSVQPLLLRLRLRLSASGCFQHQLLRVDALLRQTVCAAGSTRKDVRALKTHTSHDQKNN